MGQLDEYEVIEKVGSGSFGTICKIRRKADGRVLAWKEIHYGKMGEKEKTQLVSEVNILRDLKHPNIVRYYDRILDKDSSKIYIIMEYCDGGDLTAIIKRCRKERKYIDEDVIWKILTQIVLALEECHHRKEGIILHRDIKPDNILLDSQNNVKLSDFGLSRVLHSKNSLAQTFLGTPYYMSPEQVAQTGYNEKSDIWSLGCLIYEMCALSPPFDATSHAALNLKIRAGKYPPIPSQYSTDMNRVIKWMLEVDQSQRPSTENLLAFHAIKMCVRERKINQHYTALKKKEEELNQREQALELREKELSRRESLLLKGGGSLSSLPLQSLQSISSSASLSSLPLQPLSLPNIGSLTLSTNYNKENA